MQVGSPFSVTVLGSGVWGSALAKLAQENGATVRVWSRKGSLSLTDSLQNTDVVVSAISMSGVHTVVDQVVTVGLPPTTILVSVTKGFDSETLNTPSQIWQATFPKNPVVVLSGPNLSKEIDQGLPAATAVASDNVAATTTVQRLFSSNRFRVYTNSDRLGTELGGTLKNVFAIAVGVCEGLHLGSNARAALISRAMPELIRIGTCLGGQPETFFGLSGLGDLLATCTSPLSRNYQVGYQLAQGKALPQILADLQTTVEGVNTAQVLVTLAEREQIPIPICLQVQRLLEGKITPLQAVEALMDRDPKPESYLFQ